MKGLLMLVTSCCLALLAGCVAGKEGLRGDNPCAEEEGLCLYHISRDALEDANVKQVEAARGAPLSISQAIAFVHSGDMDETNNAATLRGVVGEYGDKLYLCEQVLEPSDTPSAKTCLELLGGESVSRSPKILLGSYFTGYAVEIEAALFADGCRADDDCEVGQVGSLAGIGRIRFDDMRAFWYRYDTQVADQLKRYPELYEEDVLSPRLLHRDVLGSKCSRTMSNYGCNQLWGRRPSLAD